MRNTFILTPLIAFLAAACVNAQESPFYMAIAFDAATGTHTKSQHSEQTTAKESVLKSNRDLGGKAPVILALSKSPGYYAIATLANDGGKGYIAGLAIGQTTAKQAEAAAVADVLKKGGKGKPTVWVWSDKLGDSEKNRWFVIAFDRTSGVNAQFTHTDRKAAEAGALLRCKELGGKTPAILVADTKIGFYGLASSYRAETKYWVAGFALAETSAVLAKEIAIKRCIQEGSTKDPATTVWDHR